MGITFPPMSTRPQLHWNGPLPLTRWPTRGDTCFLRIWTLVTKIQNITTFELQSDQDLNGKPMYFWQHNLFVFVLLSFSIVQLNTLQIFIVGSYHKYLCPELRSCSVIYIFKMRTSNSQIDLVFSQIDFIFSRI